MRNTHSLTRSVTRCPLPTSPSPLLSNLDLREFSPGHTAAQALPINPGGAATYQSGKWGEVPELKATTAASHSTPHPLVTRVESREWHQRIISSPWQTVKTELEKTENRMGWESWCDRRGLDLGKIRS